MAEIRRVLLVQPFAGTRWRSINAYAASLADLLRSRDIEVDFVSAPWFNPPSLLAAWWSGWWRQPELRREKRNEYDIVHLTDQALAHHVSRFRSNAPVVVTCHDLMPFTVPGYYKGLTEAAVKRFFLRRPISALKHADSVIGVSEYARAEAISFAGVPPAHTAVVPNVVRSAFIPVEQAEAEARLAASNVLLPAGPRVLSIGNDRAYKNVSSLLKAMAQPALAHANLVRVSAPLKGAEATLANQLGLTNRIHHLGSLSDEQLRLVYSACDVLAQPSLAEGFGVPVIEAMACGLPVVSSDGGALGEVVSGAGVVVPLGGGTFAARLSAEIASTLPRRQELAAAGLVRAQRFSRAAVAPALLAAYAHAQTAFERR